MLIIDDRPEIRGWIDRLFENEDFDVFFATSGDSGVLQAQAGQPDLILLSPALRIGNTPKVIAQIKANGCTSHIKLGLLPDLSSLAEDNSSHEDQFETCLSGASLPIGELFGQIHGAMGVYASSYA